MTVPEPPDVVVLVDNTVLCTFAAVRRMDLLEVALAARGRVTEAVHDEMVASAALLPGLRAAVNAPWLGTPVEVVEGVLIEPRLTVANEDDPQDQDASVG